LVDGNGIWTLLSKKHVPSFYKYKVKIITRLDGSVFFNGSPNKNFLSVRILMIQMLVTSIRAYSFQRRYMSISPNIMNIKQIAKN
jgi:hypothetical protein